MLIARFCSPERCGAHPVRLYENHVVVEKSLVTEGVSEAYDELMCDLQQTYWMPARPAIIGERVIIRGTGAYRRSRQKAELCVSGASCGREAAQVRESVQYAII